jgi:outer membrane lipoprotein SlyB
MAGIDRSRSRSQVDTGKVLTSIGGALLGGLLGAGTGNPFSIATGFLKGGLQGADIYDSVAGKPKQADPYANLGVTARARAGLMRGPRR